VPALADRPEDIPDLARHFLARFAAEEGKRIRRLDGPALALLSRYRWPGNVRQLENAVFRAVVLAEGDEIGATDFPQIAALAERQPAEEHAERLQMAEIPVAADDVLAPPLVDEISHPASPHIGSIAPQYADPGALSLLDGQGEVRPLEELEAEVIRFAISHYRGQMSEVARRLQIGRSTLYRKLDALGLHQKSAESDSDPVVAG
jgi:DNA-binding NtrC family response regulator